ncbi:hypothetical protein FKM82_017283 [Ascaphus truei]
MFSLHIKKKIHARSLYISCVFLKRRKSNTASESSYCKSTLFQTNQSRFLCDFCIFFKGSLEILRYSRFFSFNKKRNAGHFLFEEIIFF